MGHLVGKDIYRTLGRKIDGLTIRAPWNKAFCEVLEELYTPREAQTVTAMPFGLSTLSHISKTVQTDMKTLKPILDTLCTKGLVMDLWVNNQYHYMPSPLAVGIFEFTMMRTGNNLKSGKWAHLFHEYMLGSDALYRANFGKGKRVSIERTLPHEEAVKKDPHVEILDYEKAGAIVDSHEKFAVGLCSCRHEKLHNDKKACDTPLETCMTFGWAADYLIRRNMAREISKSESLETIALSKEFGLVLNADNVRNNVTYICQCCGCCCNLLLGYNVYGYENVVVTSSFIARVEAPLCSGCGKCAKACPINAIDMQPISGGKKKKKRAVIDTSVCIGCGVCALQCKPGAVELVKRKQRLIQPETTFHRIILQCLERGTLQNQIFGNTRSITQGFMRGVVGGFLKLTPVKQALMSDLLRSSFLKAMETGIKFQRKGWLMDL